MKSKLNICVVDNIAGAYLPAAIELSKNFNNTYFYSVTQNPFPRISNEMVGTGYSEVIILNEFWSKLDLFDIIVFADIYFSDWGNILRKMGKLVFGGTDAEELETNRKLFKDELKGVMLPIANTAYIIGANNLIKYLSDKKDKWVKISYYRGAAETFHHKDIKSSTIILQEMLHTMGPLERFLEFSIEDPIKSTVECGFDGWTINGKFTTNCITGFEIKNCAYIGKKTTQSELPFAVKMVNDRFGKVLDKYKHTGFYSTEIRVSENGTNYYTDPCMRLGSPPSNTYLKMISNWDMILLGACKGEVVEPIFIANYGVEIILKSNHCNEGFLPISFPIEYKDNIRLKGSFVLDGEYYIIPFKYVGFEMAEFGSVVVVGDNIEDIVEQALEICSQIESPYDLYYETNAMDKIMEVLENANDKLKITF